MLTINYVSDMVWLDFQTTTAYSVLYSSQELEEEEVEGLITITVLQSRMRILNF